MADKRVHVYYRGMVQGVGFRYAAERSAVALGIKGWARNRDDGSVEVMCEGPEAQLVAFLDKMDSIFKTLIRDRDVEWGEAAGEFEGFDIRE